jgi:hypothetical protein
MVRGDPALGDSHHAGRVDRKRPLGTCLPDGEAPFLKLLPDGVYNSRDSDDIRVMNLSAGTFTLAGML